MKNGIKYVLLICLLSASCRSVKITDTWKGQKENVEKFKTKNVLVLVRSANDHERIAFEGAMADQLNSYGIKATESFKKVPKIHPEKEVTEERLDLIKSLMASEGFNGIVIITVKDTKHVRRTNSVGVSFDALYPGYYNSFYGYFSQPYYGGYYYSAYVPLSTSTSDQTTYILETLAYNLDEPTENQLVSLTMASLKNPNDAYKVAPKYAEKLIDAFKKAD